MFKNRISVLAIFAAIIFLSGCGNSGPDYDVVIETEYGNMKVMLYDETPIHKENFIKLTKEGFYNDLLFHRVINGFMIQGGDPNSRNADLSTPLGQGGPGYTLPNEIGFPHFKGTLAAARNQNPEKRSSGSQFYLVQGGGPMDPNKLPKKGYNQAQKDLYAQIGGTPQLDNEYTVFGEVVEGIEVIDAIAKVQTGPGDRPAEDVKMVVRMK